MYILFAIYIFCSALALTLIKLGGNQAASLTVENGVLGLRVGWLMLAGMLLYVVSFLLSMALIPKFDLSYYYPLSAGLIYIAVTLFAVLLLRERISMLKLGGMALILSGIVLMNLKG